MHKKSGYGVDSVQKRLGEIVYVQSKPEQSLSRHGKHLEIVRDRVQMMGIGDPTSKVVLEKTYNSEGRFTGGLLPIKKVASIEDISDEEERRETQLQEIFMMK